MGFLRDRILGLVGTRSARRDGPPAGDWDEKLLSGAESGNLQLVVVALAKGANVDCATADGWTPLLTASKDRPDIVRHLLAGGADPNIATPYGYTPLMRAAGHDAVEIVHLLISAGADLHARDEKGLSARDMALQQCGFTAAELVGAALVEAMRREGRTFIPLRSEADLFWMNKFDQRVSPGYHRVEAELSDGTVLHDVRVYDTVALETPAEHVGKGVARLKLI